MQFTPRSWPSRLKLGCGAPRDQTLIERSSEADANEFVSFALNLIIIT